MNEKQATADQPPPLHWWKFAKLVISAAVIVAVAWAAWKSVSQLDRELRNGFDWSEFQPFYLLAAALGYFGAMSCGWYFWHRALVNMRQTPLKRNSFRAFFVSQLAKYIPGKAMVVVVRVSSLSSHNVTRSAAIVSVFLETITWVSVASFLAALGLLIPGQLEYLGAAEYANSHFWKLSCLGLLLATVIPTLPPVARRIILFIAGGKGNQLKENVEAGIRFPTWLFGWLIFLLGWSLNGWALWLVLHSLPGVEVTWAQWPLCLTVVTLATVIGFISFLPGGLGVRELVMVPLLGPLFGGTQAIVAAILFRLVCLAIETIVATVSRFCLSLK